MAPDLIPPSYDRPSLSQLFDRNVLNMSLDAMFRPDPVMRSGVREHIGIWTNLVRLTDKAVREYEAAFRELDDFVEHGHEGRFSPFFRGIDHIESCLNATYRAAECSRALRDLGFGADCEPLDAHELGQIRALRVEIEHLHARLVEGGLPESYPYMLFPQRSGLRMGVAHLSYVMLARSIKKLYRHVEAIRGPSI